MPSPTQYRNIKTHRIHTCAQNVSVGAVGKPLVLSSFAPLTVGLSQYSTVHTRSVSMSNKDDESLSNKEEFTNQAMDQLLLPSGVQKPRSLHDDGSGEEMSLKPPPQKQRKCHEKAPHL